MCKANTLLITLASPIISFTFILSRPNYTAWESHLRALWQVFPKIVLINKLQNFSLNFMYFSQVIQVQIYFSQSYRSCLETSRGTGNSETKPSLKGSLCTFIQTEKEVLGPWQEIHPRKVTNITDWFKKIRRLPGKRIQLLARFYFIAADTDSIGDRNEYSTIQQT